MGFSMITKAQYFMGNTESEIIKAYSNKKYKMEIKDLSSNSKQIRFLHEETNISYDYFLRDGICSMHILIAPRKALLPFIKDLNETNIKVDDNIWMDKSNTVKIELKLKDNNPYFSLICTKI